MKDIWKQDGWDLNVLGTILLDHVTNAIKDFNIWINSNVGDSWVWSPNLNGNYTAKSVYKWLMSSSHSQSIQTSTSWIWNLPTPEKVRILIWLLSHHYLATNDLRINKGMSASVICTRCNQGNETITHCLRDCPWAKSVWHAIGFKSNDFYDQTVIIKWVRTYSEQGCAVFLATLWWVWRDRNQHVFWDH